jgi:hypothetical protein
MMMSAVDGRKQRSEGNGDADPPRAAAPKKRHNGERRKENERSENRIIDGYQELRKFQ